MKRPSFQFYPGDWLNDAALRMVSIGARGLWIDMICLMHQGSDYGYLKVNGKVILSPNLARMCGATLSEVEGWVAELHDAGVFSVDSAGCIFSRRMIRDEEVRKARAAGGILGGNPNLVGSGKVNGKDNLLANLSPTPSSSSSSSSSKDKNNTGDYSPDFLTFWKAYPKKTGKFAAYRVWKKVNPPIADVLKALNWQCDSEQWRKLFIPNPETYLNQGRWQDEPPKINGSDSEWVST